jgi:hypothetical protein
MKDAVSLLPENRFYFTISCGGSQEIFRYELTLIPIKSQHEQAVEHEKFTERARSHGKSLVSRSMEAAAAI